MYGCGSIGSHPMRRLVNVSVDFAAQGADIQFKGSTLPKAMDWFTREKTVGLSNSRRSAH